MKPPKLMNRLEKIQWDALAPLRENIGREALFNCDIIDIGGRVTYFRGTRIYIRDVDCGFYRISRTRTGKMEYGNWMPNTFDIIGVSKTDKELLSITSWYRKEYLNGNIPNGLCHAVSYPLTQYFNFIGISASLSSGSVMYRGKDNPSLYSHWWVTLPDGRIIDATASQFKNIDGTDMPDIYLGDKPEWYVV